MPKVTCFFVAVTPFLKKAIPFLIFSMAGLLRLLFCDCSEVVFQKEGYKLHENWQQVCPWHHNDIGHFDMLTQLVPFADFAEARQIWMLCSKLQRKWPKPAIKPLIYRKMPCMRTNYHSKQSKMAISFPDPLFLTMQWKDKEVRTNTDNNTDCSYKRRFEWAG